MQSFTIEELVETDGLETNHNNAMSGRSSCCRALAMSGRSSCCRSASFVEA